MIKKIKMFGSQNPWVWSIDLVQGCNLKCGHCFNRLYKNNEIYYMSENTWIKIFELISIISPTCRVDICVGGEPTLHPNLIEYLKIAKNISPLSQIQITTNGTMLISKKVNYKELFDAGANILYVDMYAPEKEHLILAEQSGYEYYKYYESEKRKTKSPWTYYGDKNLKMIILQRCPDNWPKSRIRAGLLGTWYNNLDFEAAKKYGLKPVIEPLNRRCNQPFLYVTIFYTGDYLLCCQDGLGKTAGKFGNVSEGLEGFKKFWFGKILQKYRYNLRNKDRKYNEECSKCCVTFSRSDFKHWNDLQVCNYYEGNGIYGTLEEYL